MKKLLFALCVILMLPLGMAGSVRNEASIRVIVNRPATGGHLVEPVAYYYPVSNVLTMEFAAEDFEPYTLSVSSMYATVDYYVTTPFLCVPIYVTGITIDLELETNSGDLYWGSFEATGTGSME